MCAAALAVGPHHSSLEWVSGELDRFAYNLDTLVTYQTPALEDSDALWV